MHGSNTRKSMTVANLRQELARLDVAGVQLSQEVLRIAGHMQIAETELPSKIQLSEEPTPQIQWSMNTERKVGPSPKNYLAAFIRLVTASDDQIFSFVQKWGTLGIEVQECNYIYKYDFAANIATLLSSFEAIEQTCIQYKMPLDHRAVPNGETLAESIAELRSLKTKVPPGIIREEQVEGYSELPDTYRKYARQFRSVLCIISDLSGNTSTKPSDWGRAFRKSQPDNFRWKKEDSPEPYAKKQLNMIAGIVTALFREAGTYPILACSDSRFE